MKKLIRNPFFIAAILITLAGIAALIMYLVNKQRKALPQASSAADTATASPQDQSGGNTSSNTPMANTPPADQQIIRLSNPYQRSNKIKKLQKAINKKGYNLLEDGIYGELTHGAAQEVYPNFLSDGQIASDELVLMLDAASNYDSSFSWTRPAISKTGESIASIVQYTSPDASYDGPADAKRIQSALSWFNDDEELIKEILYRLSKAQIAQLLASFQSLYNQSLDDYLKGGLLWGLDDNEYDEVLAIVRSRA